MNFLAHSYLAADTDESLIGNLMGDFVKGVLKDQYQDTILEGIRQHRKIDSFADAHPCTLASRNLFSRRRRRFAGIIVDICYDHLLAKHWALFADVELADFIANVYRILDNYRSMLPENMNRTVQRMVAENWLGSYAHLDGVDFALNRMARRLKRANTLAGSVDEIKANYVHLEADFLIFFPLLIDFADKYTRSGESV
ncbi:MAG: ACP phosphodiesterase [Pseudomonadota bacterium]